MHSIDLRETEKPNLSGNSAKRRLRRVDFPTPLGPETTRGRKNSDIWQVCVDEGCVPVRKRKGESKHACISTEQPSPLCARRCPNCVYSVRAVIHSSVLSTTTTTTTPALSLAHSRGTWLLSFTDLLSFLVEHFFRLSFTMGVLCCRPEVRSPLVSSIS